MQLIDMFFDEIEDAKKRKVPFIIPIGTIEYHAHHASCGTDTMVINGVMRDQRLPYGCQQGHHGIHGGHHGPRLGGQQFLRRLL